MFNPIKAFKDWALGTRPADVEFDAYQKAITADTYIIHSQDMKFDLFRRSIAIACVNYNREVYETRRYPSPGLH